MKAILPLHKAVSLLNKWGADKIPFLFYTNYNATLWFVQKLSEVDASEVAYSLPMGSNCLKTDPHTIAKWEIEKPDFTAYKQAFDKVQEGLQRGDSFLTNLTWATPIQTNLTEGQLCAMAKAPFRLWVKGEFCVFSPEPFVHIEGNVIRTFPMKGTVQGTNDEAKQSLLNSPKEQAEHATIVDLLRNDLSIISNEVRVERYRYIEQIDTVNGPILQTSSEITGKIRSEYQGLWGDILSALLPAGSVTGAPKRRTLEIIETSEPTPRNWYTGVFGLCDGKTLQSAVMIRFVEFTPTGEWIFHSGGGITAQSDPKQEFDEMILKTHAPIHRNYPY